MINQKNGEKSGKYESLSIKEQMLGIKSSSKVLPEDFYERVLECELSLKEKFDMKVLETLIQYYSLAVEYFGSIGDDKKCSEYNENLNLLFKQMEIKKYMKEGNNIELNAKKEEIKQQMKMAENKIDSTAAKKIIKENEKKLIRPGKSIILKEIFSQTLAFKQKLENKKKKFKLKLNLDNINSSKYSKSQKSNNSRLYKIIYKHKKSKSNKNKKHKKIFEDIIIENSLNNSFQFGNNKKIFNITHIKSTSILNDNSNDRIKNDLTISKEDTEDFLSSIELNLGDECDINLNFSSQSSKAIPIIKGDITKVTKKKCFQKNLKSIISDYIQGYYNSYMKNSIDKIIKEYEKQNSNLYDELINAEVNYYNQQRQMEYLRDADEEDENYIDQIEGTLENIKKEKQNKINEINEKYNNIIQSLNNKYIFSNSNNSCHEIEILKEKMKLELTKEINNTVLK